MSEIRKGYLFLYNVIQWIGWLMVFVDRFANLPEHGLTPQGTWCLYLFQSLAIMEIVHSFTGLVRASPVTTLVQVVSRIQLIAVHFLIPQVQESYGLVPMVVAWGLVEVVRYLYLALNLLNAAPRWLLWMRYSLFYVLYPMGVYGEMRVLCEAMPYLKESGILSIALPNAWNFSFSFSGYVWVLLYVIYVPGLYVQYTHMIRQRRKALAPTDEKKNE